MAGRNAGGRRRRAVQSHEDEERWLLTYADMITLLMALFMVLFSISSVNISKYKSLQRSLQVAFSGKVVSGGSSVLDTGTADSGRNAPKDQTAVPAAIVPPRRAGAEDAEFRQLQHRIEAYASSHGLRNRLQARVAQRGLVVRLLTDDVLFSSGDAALKPGARPILVAIARLLGAEVNRPTVVEGHTDNVPIESAQYPSNWELSTARATSVVRFLIAHGARSWRLSAAGYASTRPVASNRTDAGRHRNRRVEIVVLRRNQTGGTA
jgi:chemotaxis protein MotB